MTPERRAQLATALERNELLPVLFEERRAEIMQAWRDTGDADAERREALFSELRALDNFEDQLHAACKQAGDGRQ